MEPNIKENQSNIRNFAIIAHVDHGKSTLADRLLVMTGTVSKEKIGEQFLDSNPIAREHGITIKLAPVRMEYKLSDLNHSTSEESWPRKLGLPPSEVKYILNLIDTPGHVDFSYEVVRTLQACEGAVLLVDATKGIQAQTVANYNFAKKLGLVIIPVINKIDLDSAQVEKAEEDLVLSFGFDKHEILKISAKSGENVENLLLEIIKRIPPPTGDKNDPAQALIFDSIYDEHKGIVIYTRLKNGKIKKGDEIKFISDNSTAMVLGTGYMQPIYSFSEEISSGEVGFVITNIKDISKAKVGDTITTLKDPGPALPGYMPVKPYVYLSLFPYSASEFNNLRNAFLKLKLIDASLSFTPEHSVILGPGLRCGFLGLLHAQITIERIEKEFGIDVFIAPPSIEYIVDGKTISKPQEFDMSKKEILEPYIKGEIYTPHEYLGNLLELIYKKRAIQKEIVYFGSQVKIVFEIPLSEVVFNFYDKIKSASSGFASFDYEFLEYRRGDLVRVDIALNDKVVDELSFIIHKSETEYFARDILYKLKEAIPKHQFVVSLQARIGGRVIAGEKIAALHKNVIEKLSGGDYTRKTKLLEKQKKGKEKLKKIGGVDIPKEVFMDILKS
ncbi:elongation factor 4 [Candidatus Parcubacteria bacterium]|nr:MAG: elongation factor 4 [Candidatus Parcubacteria bacterium]